MRRLPGPALAVLVVLAFTFGPGLPTPHMLGMDCSADCPECATECCCGPAVAFHIEAAAAPSFVRRTPAAVPLRAALTPRTDPRLPGAPPRGPPS